MSIREVYLTHHYCYKPALIVNWSLLNLVSPKDTRNLLFMWPDSAQVRIIVTCHFFFMLSHTAVEVDGIENVNLSGVVSKVRQMSSLSVMCLLLSGIM